MNNDKIKQTAFFGSSVSFNKNDERKKNEMIENPNDSSRTLQAFSFIA
jgi:hypothetical protein